MDTDCKFLRNTKAVTRRLIEGRRCARYRDMLTAEAGCERIRSAIKERKPFLAARLGSNESKATYAFLSGSRYSNEERERIVQHAGVFPGTDAGIDAFAEVYGTSIPKIDLMGVWYPKGEGSLIEGRGGPGLELAPLRALEPYYFKDPWSRALEGCRVLVVHPFAKTIQGQYEKRKELFADDLLPEFASLATIPAVQTIAGETAGFGGWRDALQSMEEAISGQDFDVALIGAGAYGLPLGAFVRRLGKTAIQMGGATQILFGIKGRRWDEHPDISVFFNPAWVRPAADETPGRQHVVEGGSYW